MAELIQTDSIVVLTSSAVSTFSNDKTYRYRHNTDLFYFTGCKEPDVIASIDNEGELTLFVKPKDDEYELWEGKMLGLEGAKEKFFAEKVLPFSEFESWLNSYKHERDSPIYFNFDVNPTVENIINRIYQSQTNQTKQSKQEKVHDATLLTEQIRIIKTEAEIEIMKQAQKISVEAHKQAIESTFPGIRENQLEMIYVSTFLNHQAILPNHVATIATGDNGLILHYRGGYDVLENDDLVLVDTGCEYEGYTADIARTWPINGKFSEEQRKVYAGVLEIQKQCIDMIRPGIDYWEIHQYAVSRLVDILLDLGVLQGVKQEIISEKKYYPYFPHGIGHWLGMDTHDCLSVDREGKILEKGMILTIEPGLYLHHHDNVPRSYRGIAIRIEDNVVVTDEGCTVLSEDLPKEIEDLESLVGTTEKYCIDLKESR